jgi:hypothetical protein
VTIHKCGLSFAKIWRHVRMFSWRIFRPDHRTTHDFCPLPPPANSINFSLSLIKKNPSSGNYGSRDVHDNFLRRRLRFRCAGKFSAPPTRGNNFHPFSCGPTQSGRIWNVTEEQFPGAHELGNTRHFGFWFSALWPCDLRIRTRLHKNFTEMYKLVCFCELCKCTMASRHTSISHYLHIDFNTCWQTSGWARLGNIWLTSALKVRKCYALGNSSLCRTET